MSRTPSATDAPAAYAPPSSGDATRAATPNGADGASPNAGLDALPNEVDDGGPAGGLSVPRDTTPTWEIELLVSGIVLVGLMQIPPWLHELWRHRAPQASLLGAAMGAPVLLALDGALYALIGCFLVNLALRGFWVALVGANSVFPRGVRWDKQREYGPIQAEIMQARVRPLPSFIARADNAASLVFATGFVLAASALSSLVFVTGLGVVLWALSSVLSLKAALVGFAVIGGLFSATIIGAATVDMRRGAKLPRGGRSERAVRAVLRAISALTPDGVRSLGAVLTSNIDKRVVYGVVLVGLLGAYGSAQVWLDDADDLPGRSNYAYFAEDPRAGVVTAANYESLRADADAPLSAPSIQSDVVTEPYIRLFVPYRVSRHDAALRRACPTLQPPPEDGTAPGAASADAAVLACAAKVHAVTLDGRPVTEGRFRFFTNPRTERRGFLMLIPATNLAPGEHVLAVQPARRNPSPSDTAPIRIPFWR